MLTWFGEVPMLDFNNEAEEVLSASLKDDDAVTFRGHIDLVDSDHGIEGWALNLESPNAPVRLRLLVGSTAVAECSTAGRREDVTLRPGDDLAPGFSFGTEILGPLRGSAKLRFEDRLKVQVVGTPYILPSATPSPRFRDILGLGKSIAPEKATRPLDLSLRLATLRADASSMVGRVYRAWPEQLVGFLEALAVDDSGTVWVIGWKRDGVYNEAPAVIVDTKKAAAGFAFTSFGRGDVPTGSHGIVGVISTDWRPADQGDFHLYLGGGGQNYLRPSDGLKVLSFDAFASQLASILPLCQGGHSASLRRMLTSPQSWAIAGEASGFTAKAALDRLLLLPGFGAIAEGWVLCPTKSVAGVSLRVGSTALIGDPTTYFTKSRPDIVDAFPVSAASVGSAGFVVVFRGPLTEDDLAYPILKMSYADDTSTNHMVDMAAIQRLDRGGGLDAALLLYPSLTQESFFQEFSLALRSAAARAISPPRPHHVSPARQVLVSVLREDRSDIFLQMTQMSAALEAVPEPPGLVLIALAGSLRPDIVGLVGAFRSTLHAPLSLYFVDDTAQVLRGLVGVLKELGASRFVFLGEGIFLTEAGWKAAMSAARDCEATLHILVTDEEDDSRTGPPASASAFSWLIEPFETWIDNAPLQLSGVYRFDRENPPSEQTIIHFGAARKSVVNAIPATIQAIDQVREVLV